MSALIRSTLLSAALLSLQAVALAGNVGVGVSVNINQPGFFGRVDIGNTPPPVIYQQPVIIRQSPVAEQRRPIYLRVPPGHERRWARFCDRYQACGQRVLFVRPDWRWDRRHVQDRREERWDDRYEHRHDDRGERRDHGHDHRH